MPVNEATCKIFVGDTPLDNNYRDGTFSGSSGDASDSLSSESVKVGYKVWAVWAGGDAGANAILNITGSKEIQ